MSGATLPEGPLLALDTSGAYGSVAVGVSGRILGKAVIAERAEHAARLVPALADALTLGGIERRDVAGIVVGEGPGSFTGVRVAAATAKGLARALSLPLWAVSSLAAAAAALHGDPVRYVLFDARSDRVYGACYGVGHAEVQTLVAPHAGALRDVMDSDVPAGSVFVGDAAVRHRALIEAAGYTVDAGDDADTLAEGLLRYLWLRPDHAPVTDLGRWEPDYVREWGAGRT